MRGHRHEISLQLGQPLLMGQLLLEQGGLAGEHALAVHQFDRVVAKDDGGMRHLVDFVAARSPRDSDIGLVRCKTAHTFSQIAQRRRNGPADMDQCGDNHHGRNHE